MMIAEFVDTLQVEMARAVNRKQAVFHHDHTSKVRVFGRTVGKRGREFTGYGETGVAEISSRVEGEGLATQFVFDCEIPWSGHWVLKHFHAGTFDYRKEEKNQAGTYRLELRVHAFGGRIELLTAESLTALDHDSRTMPVRALEAHFLTNAEYLRKELFE